MAISSNRLGHVCWRIIPRECPRVVRRCPRCCRDNAFVCSEKFRVNAHQRRVDVWLVYRCGVCDSTWKAPVFERCLPKGIGPDLYRRFQSNDRELAWRYAFDRAWLRRVGVRVDDRIPFRVERRDANVGLDHMIHLEFDHPFRIRLDRLLAQALGISRSRVAKRWKQGFIATENGVALRQSVRNGLTIRIADEVESRDPNGAT